MDLSMKKCQGNSHFNSMTTLIKSMSTTCVQFKIELLHNLNFKTLRSPELGEQTIKDSASWSHLYPILRAFLLADPREYESMRRRFNGLAPAHDNDNNNNSRFIASTIMSCGKRKCEDEKNASRKK
uniref:Uncharacterized protein n=1 Tax=Glyptapanteles indiensis TaxID=92994 RepID=B7S948_GLYIN|nr:hypothetical protein GIP_L8_0370 [Glyptapanteles indiensis]